MKAIRVLMRDAANACSLPDGVEIVEGDIADPAARREAVSGVDAVVHLAANLRAGDPASMPLINLESAVALGREALEARVQRFVFISTNLVYGPGRDRPAREDDPLRPSTAFGVYPNTKAAAERALLELHRNDGLPVRIIRSAFVYGDGDPHLEESLRWASEWAPHKRLHMVHHADVAQGLLLVLHAHDIDGRVYNVADDAPVTSVELFDLNGRPVPADLAHRKLEEPWEGIVSTTRIRTELGYRPIYPTAWAAWHAGSL